MIPNTENGLEEDHIKNMIRSGLPRDRDFVIPSGPILNKLLEQKRLREIEVPGQPWTRLFEFCWDYDAANRPTFSFLATELRSLHDFIGRNMKTTPGLNFNIVEMDHGFIFSQNTTYYSHVWIARAPCIPIRH